MSSLLTESVAPELLLMETKWSSLVSYGMTVDALTDFLPLDVTLDVKTVRHDGFPIVIAKLSNMFDNFACTKPLTAFG